VGPTKLRIRPSGGYLQGPRVNMGLISGSRHLEIDVEGDQGWGDRKFDCIQWFFSLRSKGAPPAAKQLEVMSKCLEPKVVMWYVWTTARLTLNRSEGAPVNRLNGEAWGIRKEIRREEGNKKKKRRKGGEIHKKKRYKGVRKNPMLLKAFTGGY